MYGRPDDFDGAALVGHELVQVSFTVNTVNLSFEGDMSITVGWCHLPGRFQMYESYQIQLNGREIIV